MAQPSRRVAYTVARFVMLYLSISAIFGGSGSTRSVGIAGVVLWLTLDTDVERRRKGWRAALQFKALLLIFVALFALTLTDPLWTRIVGSAGLFMGVWVGVAVGTSRRRHMGRVVAG